MSNKTTLQRVQEATEDQLGVNLDTITPEANFVADLGADSLDTIELIMAFEEEFDLEIHDEEAELVKTVQQAVDLIDSKLN